MGERIGLPKLEMKHDGSTRITKKVVQYCRRDTEIVGRFVYAMNEKYKEIGATLKTTIASTTLNYFETKFYKRVKHRFTEEQIDFFHSGYYGGRTEIFHNHPIEGQIWYCDVNSLYPHCLKVGEYPDLEEFYETTKPDFSRFGMADVLLEAPREMQIPYLPHRIAESGKLVFPLGTFRGVYTFYEIREALRLGYRIHETYRAIEFPSSFNPFAKFIDTLYFERLKAQASKDDLMQMTYKSLMNYCYGKFAQRNESTKLVPIVETNLKGGDVLFGDLVLRKERIKYPRYANCIWACYVTAYARHLLHSALSKVHEAGGLLLYCDTDSVIFEHPNNILGDSRNLGEFKLEHEYAYAHFKLPKLYCLKSSDSEAYRAKGVPFGVAREFFTDGRASFQRPLKLRETLRRNMSPKRTEKLIANYWTTFDKELKGQYDKRIVNKKDGSTRPIFIS
jgi:hypothetical protein